MASAPPSSSCCRRSPGGVEFQGSVVPSRAGTRLLLVLPKPLLNPPISWASSSRGSTLSAAAMRLARGPCPLLPPTARRPETGLVRAAWTRRSRGDAAKKPNRKSWKQRTDMYMRPFLLNVFFSRRFIHAKVMHRGTCKVVSVASTNSKELRNTLPSPTDEEACRTVGRLIAERSKEADVFAVAYETKRDGRIEGKLGIVIDTMKENGIVVFVE